MVLVLLYEKGQLGIIIARNIDHTSLLFIKETHWRAQILPSEEPVDGGHQTLESNDFGPEPSQKALIVYFPKPCLFYEPLQLQ